MRNIATAVDKHRKLILDAERYIWAHPETGYKEFETSAYMANIFRELGYEVTMAEGITGFYTVLDTGKPGPEILVLGELDSVICPTHPESNPITGAVHSCGHNAQCAALIGVAAALKEPGIIDGLSGRIRLCAVPAEELLEIGYRSELKKQGKIKYFGGKSEFLHRGYFDGVDIAFMVHTASSFACRSASVGCLAKKVIYKGVAAHAGGAPWNGRNALYAATSGINSVNAIRETLKEGDLIRIHPIITHGGDMVNAIPERVEIESYVRGRTFRGIEDANKKVNRALTGAAYSLGTNIEIIDTPGYAPLENAPEMITLAKDAAEALGLDFKYTNVCGTGSTDMGDLSQIMPVIHPYAPGAIGRDHGSDYYINDPESACVTNAKWQLKMLELLLKDGAERAKRIKENFSPNFASKEEFLAYQDSLNSSGDRILYNEDGTANLR